MESVSQRIERIAAEIGEIAASLAVALDVDDEQIAKAFCQHQGRWGSVTNDEWPGYLRGAQGVRVLMERAVVAERERWQRATGSDSPEALLAELERFRARK